MHCFSCKKIYNKKPLLVLAADTFILSDLEKDIENTTNSEGLIQLINLPGDQWSFASLGKEKIIISVAEKKEFQIGHLQESIILKMVLIL